MSPYRALGYVIGQGADCGQDSLQAELGVSPYGVSGNRLRSSSTREVLPSLRGVGYVAPRGVGHVIGEGANGGQGPGRDVGRQCK